MKSLLTLPAILFLSLSAHAQNALNFDGVNDRVSCGNSTSVQLSASLTLEAWIYPTGWQTQVWQGNIINKENNNPDYGYMLRCGNGGQLNFNLGNGTWHEITSATGTLTLNTWQHVAATYNGSKMVIYLNGSPIDSMSLSITVASSLLNLTIGNWSNPGTDRCFIGSIDEARVWNVARTKAQINNTMNGELCSTEPGLVACYRLNEGVAGGTNAGVTSTTDFSGNNNTGILTGFALSGSGSNWVTGSGINPGSRFVQQSITGCNEYVSPGGNTYDSSGVYLDTLQTSFGCDSVIETTLTMRYVDVGVIVTSTTLTSNEMNGTFRWLDCNNNYAVIPGGTSRTFTPTDPNGSYAVSVEVLGCKDTSDCYSLQGVGLLENHALKLKVYPNPAKGMITVEHPQGSKGTIQIFDLTGSEVIRLECSPTGRTTINIEGQPAGIYLIKCQLGDYEYTDRVSVK